MNTLRRTALLLALAASLALPLGVRAADLTLTAQAETVNAGETIRFVGAGFGPGERVVTWATAPDQDVLSGKEEKAGADGRVELFFEVPRNALGGRWAFTAFGLVGRTPVAAAFQVNGRDPGSAPLQIAVEPAAAAPGETFAFAARGYKGDETISYWVTAPDGSIYAARPESRKANSDGRVDFRWASGGDAPRGIYVMTIQGITSGTARAVRFEIR
jgi:hypothetical protein